MITGGGDGFRLSELPVGRSDQQYGDQSHGEQSQRKKEPVRFQSEGPTTEEARFCLVAKGTMNS